MQANTNTGTKRKQSTEESQEDSTIEIATELKDLCLNAAERYLAVRVPALSPSLLAQLVQFLIAKGLELVDHWGEEDIDDPLSGYSSAEVSDEEQ